MTKQCVNDYNEAKGQVKQLLDHMVEWTNKYGLVYDEPDLFFFNESDTVQLVGSNYEGQCDATGFNFETNKWFVRRSESGVDDYHRPISIDTVAWYWQDHILNLTV